VPGVLKPDGSELVVSIPAGVSLWDLHPEAQLRAACAIAGREPLRG